MFDAFHDVEEKRQTGNTLAQEVMESWANAEWFLGKPEVPSEIKVTVYKVPGETNTDDLSPAVDAWSRPDIPLHAQAMLKARMENPLDRIEELKKERVPTRLRWRYRWYRFFPEVGNQLSPLAYGQ